MIRDTIEKIEQNIQKVGAIKTESKTELLSLLARLKSEIADISNTNVDEAQSIAGFTELSAHEATREKKNPQLLELSLKGLSSSVAGFEESHPKLVETINAICVALSNLGI